MNNEAKYGLLKRVYGYDSFRAGQEEVVDSILGGRDTFAVMPTGAGKSICYQLPALLSDGITLVISPLISLMKDQVAALCQLGVRAAFLNSSLTQRQYVKALSNARDGMYKIIYVAPERLTTDAFLDFAQAARIPIVAIDEAHCVSQWGQDFRPGYLSIPGFIESLPVRPVTAAFTATATAEVREDVSRLLRLREPNVFITGFDRPNLYYEVRELQDREKYPELFEYVRAHQPDSGIVYCATRKNVDDVCVRLLSDGISASKYHAGMDDAERSSSQDDFIYDRSQVIVATNAFGMGIDKSNVRFVIHYNMPKNIESYYQEAGRAGRDGERSDCILLYSSQDSVINRFLIENSSQSSADAENPITDEQREQLKARDYDRLRKMTLYCTGTGCLRAFMLSYFGEKTDRNSNCKNCGNCVSPGRTVDVTAEAVKLIGLIDECSKDYYSRSYGTSTLIETLRGSGSEKLQRARLDESSYYGSLAMYGVRHLRSVIDALIAAEVLEISDGEYPVVLKKRGLSKDERIFMKPVVEKSAKKPQHKPQPAPGGQGFPPVTISPALDSRDEKLLAELKKLRKELADNAGVPAYVVFSDKTLSEMSRYRPQTRAQMLEISGVGEVKFERYGERFLGVIMAEGGSRGRKG